jgi:UDP-N-acetylglucosamine transferase subunit ALG13
MILTTVGLHDRPFERLVRAADGMAALTSEPVIIQRGVARYVPEHAAWFDTVSAEQMISLVSQARVLVSHAGAGSVLTAARARVPLVLVPRLCRWGEAIDDHQMELGVALAVQGRATLLRDVSAALLLRAVAQAQRTPGTLPGTGLQQALSNWLAGVVIRPVHQPVLGEEGAETT